MQLNTKNKLRSTVLEDSLHSSSLSNDYIFVRRQRINSFNRNGQKSEFNGGRTENEIVNWILKKVGPASSEVSCDGLKQKTEQHKLVLAYFGDDTSAKEH